VSLQSVGNKHLPDLVLKCLDQLLLLLLGLLLAVGSDASLNNYVMIVVVLSLLLQSAPLRQFVQLQS